MPQPTVSVKVFPVCSFRVASLLASMLFIAAVAVLSIFVFELHLSLVDRFTETPVLNPNPTVGHE